jgi:hypothetical protein
MKALSLFPLLVALGAGCDSQPLSGSGTPAAGAAGAASSAGSSNSAGGTGAASGNGAGGSAGSRAGSAGAGGAQQPSFTSDELLINGDAEQGVTGWTASGADAAIAAEAYGATDYPSPSDPGPGLRGGSFFRGSDNTNVDAHQEVDLTPFADRIATGLRFKLKAYLGGYAAQDDHASVVVRLLAADGTLLESSTLGGPLAAERMNLTALIGCSLDGKLPDATRRIDVHLVMRRAGGVGNDGYADNLSLVLHD